MSRYLIEAILHVGLVVPAALLLLKAKRAENYLRILLFALIYIVYQMILILPKLSGGFNLIQSRWNWEGKAFGIVFGIICYFLFRKHFRENDFFTLRQDRDGFRPALWAAAASVVLVTVVAYLMGKSEFDAETLVFQLTMPAIDEEIMFRGILLGLLATGLKDRIPLIGSPAVILTAVLFGFIHALSVEKDLSIGFEPVYFVHTAVGGLIFGWIALKSRSLVLPVAAHGLANFLAALVTMIK